MRISDLSRQSGVPIATIKYYMRAGLLPPGEPTARNQARYGPRHLRRLTLVRALSTIGQLDLASVHDLLTAVEDDGMPVPELFDTVSRIAMPAEPPDGSTAGGTAGGTARTDVDRLVTDLGWHVRPDAPARDRLTRVLGTLRELGCEESIGLLAQYAATADHLAAHELSLVPAETSTDDRAAAAVRAILLDVAFSALRRMAHESRVRQRFQHGGGA